MFTNFVSNSSVRIYLLLLFNNLHEEPNLPHLSSLLVSVTTATVPGIAASVFVNLCSV